MTIGLAQLVCLISLHSLVLLLTLALAGCTAGEGSHPAAPLTLVEVTEVPAEGGSEVFSVRLGREGDDREILAYLRRPADRGLDPLPAMVLLAGRQGGRDAARVLPDGLPFAVLAVEYPEDLPEHAGPVEALRKVERIRRTASTIPDVLVDAGRVLAGMEEVDGDRIAVMGVSFGVPFAAAAGSDPVFSAAILAFGGAGLRDLVATNLPRGNAFTRRLVGTLFAARLREFEPARHVPRISPTPLLLINGIHDELIPRHTAARLGQAARPPTKHVWLEDGHVGMAHQTLIDRVGQEVATFLAEVWSDDALAGDTFPGHAGR
jgi:dienelactone hydrolase